MDEMEKFEGKRVLPAKKLPLGGKIAIIAGAALIALAVGGYLGLCGYVGSTGVILPNTTAAGIEIGGLTYDAAWDKLDKETKARFGNQNISFQYPGGTAEVKGDSVEIDASGVAKAAAYLGRENGFIGGGAAYITAFFGGSELAAPLRFSQEGEREVDDMLANIEDHLTQKVEETTHRTTEDSLVLVKGVSGMSIDAEALKREILAAFQGDKSGSSAPAFTVEPQITAPAEPDFEGIYTELHVEAADAYLDKTTKEIVHSVTGISFDIATAQALLERTDEGAVCKVPLSKTEPKMTTEKLTAALFKDVLGSTKTWASGPAPRRYNIKLACSFVNGTILLPGEVFSYNGACEPYTVGNGYQKAGTYQNGQSVDATAGGICQLSSTLYWATLEANLETVERSKHQFNGGYMPIVGTDATVWGGGADFKFKNDTEYPVKLEAYMDDKNNVYVTITGTSNGLRGEPFNKVLSTSPARSTYKPDASVPQGTSPQKDSKYTAYDGITVETYLRVVDADGNTVDTKFLHKNTYAKRDAVYNYNPADAALWGIDPATGLKTMAPVVPTPSPDPNVPPVDPNVPVTPSATPSVDPAPGTDPGGIETPMPTPTDAPANTPPPGIPVDVPTPLPSVTPVPTE